MPKLKLTEAAIRRLQPTPGKQTLYFDTYTRGLVITVNHASRTFSAMYYDPPGKARYYRLGRYGGPPDLSLEEARTKARKFLAAPKEQLRRDAEDARFDNLPVEQFAAAIVEANGGHYFEGIAEEFLIRHVRARGLRTAREIERILRYYVLPGWRDTIITTIRRREVSALISHIEDHHGQAQANSVLKVLSSLFRWYADNHAADDYSSPINNRMQRGDSVKRDRVLDDGELATVWHACGDDPGFPAIVKLCLLTAQRSRKIATMQWTDVVDGTWTIRTEKREKGNGGVLVLPEVAVQIIERQPRLPGSPFVFASRLSRSGYFTIWSDGKQALDAKLPPMERWTLHDLRRTARTLMSRAKVAPHVAEMVLGHSLGSIESIYNRWSFTPEKGSALRALAELIGQIVNPTPGNVFALRNRARELGEAQRAS